MDLFAYTQIESLQEIADKNGISVPRCRGYRLMKDEKPVTPEDIAIMIESDTLYLAGERIKGNPLDIYIVSSNRTLARWRHYMKIQKDEKGHERPIAIRWDRVHGKLRKDLKWIGRIARKRVLEQYSLWNSFAGKENVLYIHARIGRTSWTSTEDKNGVCKQSWFLAKVDDHYDTSYCDIYARIHIE